MQEGLATLRGSMLGLIEGDAPKEGEPSPLAVLDASEARKVGLNPHSTRYISRHSCSRPLQPLGKGKAGDGVV